MDKGKSVGVRSCQRLEDGGMSLGVSVCMHGGDPSVVPVTRLIKPPTLCLPYSLAVKSWLF